MQETEKSKERRSAMWFDTLTIVWGRKTILLVILATAAASLTAAESRLKSGLKPNKADRRVLHNCPNPDFIETISEPKPIQRDSIAASEGFTLDSIIEVGSNITTNQIWTANNIYHITANISVKALLVIEPGTTIKFASGRTMAVNDGGTLISAGTPDNPIVYMSDSATPSYNDYNCPIQIEETASSSTKVTYNYIEYANVGIKVINKRLDNPLENNYFYRSYFGIREYGIEHTDIINNLVYDMWNYGIDVNMASATSEGSANSHILIQNNTCDYCYVGIVVRGVANYDDSGDVTVTNNIVSNSGLYGLALVNGYMYEYVANTGYYNNANDTLEVYTNYNPAYETTNPFVTGTGTLPDYYLRQNSNFINASDEYIEQTLLIGKTTAINSFPDSNLVDLGFHYPNWQFSNAGSSMLTADFDNNYKVDFNDLMLFAGFWLYDYNDNQRCAFWDLAINGKIDLFDLDMFANNWLTEYDFVDFADFAKYWRKSVDYRFTDRRFDLVADNVIDFRDFAMFANQWRQETTNPNPAIAVTISGDPNNLTGTVTVGISGRPSSIEQGFIYVDGELKGNIDYRLDPEITSIYVPLDTFTIANGLHEIKAVVIDTNGLVTVSQKIMVTTNNAIYYFVRADSFNEGEDYHLYAMSGSSDDLRVKLYNWDGTLAWTSASAPGNLNLSIPSSTFTGEIYDMAVEASGGGWHEIWKEAIGKKYDINGNYKVQIFLPNGLTPTLDRVAKSRQQAVAELVRWSRARGFTCAVWYLGQANWKTFSTQVTKANTKIIYIVSHGYNTFRYKGTTTNRLNFLISSGSWFGGTEYVLSHKEDIPGANTDTSIHSLRELGLAQTNHLKIIYHTACRMGQSNEMAREWIDLDLPLDQIFVSFIGTVPTFSPNWQLWDYQVWNQWGDGQARWYDVFDYCSRSINNPDGPQIGEQIGSFGDSQTRFN